MGDVMVAMIQDPRLEPRYTGKTYGEICNILMADCAAGGGTGAIAGVFDRLARYDITGLAAFLDGTLGTLPDGRKACLGAGACMGDAVVEGSAVVLDDSRKIMPGDLCAFTVRAGFLGQVKQYIGRWNNEYGFLGPNRREAPGHLFYCSTPRIFCVVHGDDLTSAARVSSIITPDGREDESEPWGLLDHRGEPEFEEAFTYVSIDRMKPLECTPLDEWAHAFTENRAIIAAWLEGSMTAKERKAFIRANREHLKGAA